SAQHPRVADEEHHRRRARASYARTERRRARPAARSAPPSAATSTTDSPEYGRVRPDCFFGALAAGAADEAAEPLVVVVPDAVDGLVEVLGLVVDGVEAFGLGLGLAAGVEPASGSTYWLSPALLPLPPPSARPAPAAPEAGRRASGST